MKQAKIHSARFSANQQKVTVYTSSGRVQITIQNNNIQVHLRPHKSKTLVDPRGWAKAAYNTVLFMPKRIYKAVRTARNLGSK
jgi:hypothetical protein